MTERMKMYMLCGPAFSGKTTLARVIADELDAELVSTDEINAERRLHGSFKVPPGEWARTHRIAQERLSEVLEKGKKTVVLDDSNANRTRRQSYRAVALRYGYEPVLVLCDVAEEVIWERIEEDRLEAKRRAFEPDLMKAHLRTFEWPGADEDPLRFHPGDDPEEWVEKNLG